MVKGELLFVQVLISIKQNSFMRCIYLIVIMGIEKKKKKTNNKQWCDFESFVRPSRLNLLSTGHCLMF